MSRTVVFGQASYLHVRSLLFALDEKGVAYRLQPAETMPVLSAENEAGPSISHNRHMSRAPPPADTTPENEAMQLAA